MRCDSIQIIKCLVPFGLHIFNHASITNRNIVAFLKGINSTTLELTLDSAMQTIVPYR
jgi:hypothetical protein